MICWVLQWHFTRAAQAYAAISAGAIVIVERRVEFNAARRPQSFTVRFGSSAENGQKISGRPLLDLIA